MTSSSRGQRRITNPIRIFSNINFELDNYEIGEEENLQLESLLLNNDHELIDEGLDKN